MWDIDVTIALDTYNGLNVRQHWGARARTARRQRATVGDALWKLRMPPGPWHVRLTRYATRSLDTDGLAAALKSVRDAVAVRLGVDDGPRAPVAWEVAQERGPGPQRVRVQLRGARHAGDLGSVEGLSGSGAPPLRGEGDADPLKRETLAPKRPRALDGLGFVGHLDKGAAVGADLAPERHSPDALAPRPLHSQRAPHARPDGRPLVRGEGIEQRAHERRFGPVSHARAVGRDDARARGPREPFRGRGHDDVTREPVPSVHDEEAGAVFFHGREGTEKARPFVDGRPSAHAAVLAPRHDLDALARRPSFDLDPLRVEPKRLVSGRNAHVRDRLRHVPSLRLPSLRHAGSTSDTGPYSNTHHMAR